MTCWHFVLAQVATDAQRVYAKVLDHFNGSLVQHVVYYGDEPLDAAFFGSLAQRTGGMLMEPTADGYQVLSTGLLHIIKLLLSQFPGGPPPPAPAEESEDDLPPMDDWLLYDLQELHAVETEEVRPGHGPVACLSLLVGVGQGVWGSLLARGGHRDKHVLYLQVCLRPAVWYLQLWLD
jgi:hypothetical protein